jgi:nucleoside-diphosphate-sugar epimerase
MSENVQREVCVIGGSRYIGKRLIRRLLDSGARVTVINRGSAPAPDGTERLVADRDDERALEAVLGGRRFDAVIDQVCYTPRQAAIARRVFGPRTLRYVMTSTVEVYGNQDCAVPLPEAAVDLGKVAVEMNRPWDAPGYLQEHYGEGKRQAEAVFAQDPELPWVSVRLTHVLGGDDDFTGRVTHYADRMRSGEPIAVPVRNHRAGYIRVSEAAGFLAWTAERDFTGPVNATAHGPLTTEDICAAIGRLTGWSAVFREVDGGEVSPLSFARAYAMDNARAGSLGYSFSHTGEWLDLAIAETVR